MADVQKNSGMTVPAPTAATPANGGTATNPALARPRVKREVPTIAINGTKAEYDEIRTSLSKILGGLELNVALGPYVLACALKTIRGSGLTK